MVEIPEMELGNLNFRNIGTVVVDLNHTFEIKCLQIDGIFGANQMSKAIWEINYATEEITVTNDLSNLDLSDVDHTLSFVARSAQKTPLVQVAVADTTYYLTYDTGSNNALELPIKKYRNLAKSYPHVSIYGSSSAGVFGISQTDTILKSQIPVLLLDTTQFFNQVITLTNTSNVIGNKFLKDYITILDWNTEHIHLKKVKEPEMDPLQSFGVKYRYQDGKFMVIELILNAGHQMQLGDVILNINDIDLTNLTEPEVCHHLFNESINKLAENTDTVSITYVRNNDVITEVLHKKTYFEPITPIKNEGMIEN